MHHSPDRIVHTTAFVAPVVEHWQEREIIECVVYLHYPESYSVLTLGDNLQTFEVVATPKPINVAYSNVNLDFHMDLVYYESPPGLQLLFAIR